MDENENLVIDEITENVEETTTEEIVDNTPAPKTFTQDEVDSIVKKVKARTEAKITKQYERKYGELTDVLKAGSGETSVEGITEKFRSHYESRGVNIPQRPSYSERDIVVLAQADADEIIRDGYEEVVEEVDRLARIGVDNMNPREKALFKSLAEYRRAHERQEELISIGASQDIYDSKEYKEYRKLFAVNTPEKVIYDNFLAKQPKKEVHTMGSVKNSGAPEPKEFYTAEEIEKLTEDELKNPEVWNKVRRSMTRT